MDDYLGAGSALVASIACLFSIVRRPKVTNNNYDPEKSGTTLLPVPVSALTCDHKWKEKAKDTLIGEGQKLVVIMTCELCGAIDKTIENIRPEKPGPKVEPPVSECRHSWKTKKEVTLSSAFEQASKALEKEHSNNVTASRQTGKKLADSKSVMELIPKGTEEAKWMFRKTYHRTDICSKCGKIHTVSVENHDAEETD